jgi:hypothetical protein
MITEIRTEIITSRENLDGLKANVDLTKASQSYILTGLPCLSLFFFSPARLNPPIASIPEQAPIHASPCSDNSPYVPVAI